MIHPKDIHTSTSPFPAITNGIHLEDCYRVATNMATGCHSYMHQIHSASSLAARGTEVVMVNPPGQTPPRSPSPSALNSAHKGTGHNATQSAGNHNEIKTGSDSHKASFDLVSRPNSDRKGAHSFPEATLRILPPPPRPPMSKSSQKILQLTGFDPRYEETFPAVHRQQPVSPTSSESSGSVYSQPEGAYKDSKASRVNSWESALAVLNWTMRDSEHLQPSVYSSSEKSGSPSFVVDTGRAASQRRRERQKEKQRISHDLIRDHVAIPSIFHCPLAQISLRLKDGYGHDFSS